MSNAAVFGLAPFMEQKSLLTREVLREELQRFGSETLRSEITEEIKKLGEITEELKRFYTESFQKELKTLGDHVLQGVRQDLIAKQSVGSMSMASFSPRFSVGTASMAGLPPGAQPPVMSSESSERPPVAPRLSRSGTGSASAGGIDDASPWSFEIRRRRNSLRRSKNLDLAARADKAAEEERQRRPSEEGGRRKSVVNEKIPEPTEKVEESEQAQLIGNSADVIRTDSGKITRTDSGKLIRTESGRIIRTDSGKIIRTESTQSVVGSRNLQDDSNSSGEGSIYLGRHPKRLLPGENNSVETFPGGAEDMRRLSERSIMSLTSAEVQFSCSIEGFVKSSYLDYASTIFIILNSVMLGVQTDVTAADPDAEEHPVFVVLEKVFFVVFSVELFLRIWVYRCGFFYRSGWVWSYFDFFVVGIQWFEEIMWMISKITQNDRDERGDRTQGFSVLRVLRILRLVRVLRLVRIMHLITELRAIVVAISSSMKSLGWTLLLLLLCVYITGIYLTQLVTDERKSGLEPEASQLNYFFGSLTRSLLTLYQIITGGIDWNDVADPLIDYISPLIGILLCLYVAFVLFALMNVVTGVFVDSALKSTKNDQDEILLQQIKQILQTSDVDRSGTISWEEFRSKLETQAMKSLFKALELDTAEARDLFRLIDIDNSGEISPEELIYGCLKLRGTAKAIDMHAFIFEYKRFVSQMKHHSDFVEEELSRIATYGVTVQMVEAPSNGDKLPNIPELSLSELRPEHEVAEVQTEFPDAVVINGARKGATELSV